MEKVLDIFVARCKVASRFGEAFLGKWFCMGEPYFKLVSVGVYLLVKGEFEPM